MANQQEYDLVQRLTLSSQKATGLLLNLGYRTIFDISTQPRQAFIEQATVPVQSADGEDPISLTQTQAAAIYTEATTRVENLKGLYRAWKLRQSPVLKGIPALEVDTGLEELEAALQRSFGSDVTFADLFPERSPDGYADAASVQSLFSPARYAALLYRVSSELTASTDNLNIAKRRSDLGKVVLSDNNVNETVDALDVLLNALDVNIDRLRLIYAPMWQLPYHDELAQIWAVLAHNDLDLNKVWDILAPSQVVIGKLDTTFNEQRTRELLGLSANGFFWISFFKAHLATLAPAYSFPQTITIEEFANTLNNASDFGRKTGLSFNELLELTGQKDYANSDGAYLSRYKLYGSSSYTPLSTYGQTAIYKRVNDKESLLWVSSEQPGATLNLTTANAQSIASNVDQYVRLRQHTGLTFEEIDWIAQNAGSGQISKTSLYYFGEYNRLHKKYGIDANAFVTFFGQANPYAEAHTRSFYEKTFSNFDYSFTIPISCRLEFAPDKQDSYEAIVLNALDVTADEFYRIGMYCFDDVRVITTLEAWGQLYRMGAAARMLGLTFTELETLWKLMADGKDTLIKSFATAQQKESKNEALLLFQLTEKLLAWMDSANLDIPMLQAMITSNYLSIATPELYNFLQSIHQDITSISASQALAQTSREDAELLNKLSHLLASGFGVKANVMAKICAWVAAVDTSFTLENYLDALQSFFSSNPPDPLSALEHEDHVKLLVWSQQLSQHVLVTKWAGLEEQDLDMLLEHTCYLTSQYSTPPVASLTLVQLLYQFKIWQTRLVATHSEALRYFYQANGSGYTQESAVNLLSGFYDWDMQFTQSLVTELFADGFPVNVEQAYQLERWGRLAEKLKVGSTAITLMNQLALPADESDSPLDDSTFYNAAVQSLAQQLTATSQSSSISRAIKEARRDACTAYYQINNVPLDVASEVPSVTLEILSEYLLLDTQNSGLVKTSPIAESVNSLQTYINRVVYGLEVPTSGKDYFSTGKFLDNWKSLNKWYSTWAGKEKLKFYAADYIDPSLRKLKTDLFTEFEANISQGRLTNDSVADALLEYTVQFETLLTLDYISACQGATDDTIYFVGRTKEAPYEYYWRRLFVQDNNVDTAQWSNWSKITAPLGDSVVNNYVVPSFGSNTLNIVWIDRKQAAAPGTDNSKPAQVDEYQKWKLLSNGRWVSVKVADPYFTYDGLTSDAYALSPNTCRYYVRHNDPVACDISVSYNSAKGFHLSYTDRTKEVYPASGSVINKVTVFDDSIHDFEPLLLPGDVPDNVDFRVLIDYTTASGDRDFLHLKSHTHISRFELPASFGTISADSLVYTYPSNKYTIALKPDIVSSDLSVWLTNAISDYTSSIVTDYYDIQTIFYGSVKNSFGGAYGIYFWELFFHIPLLVASRLQTEQRFDEAQFWLTFIFSPTGYRDESGTLQTVNDKTRYYNVVPLQEAVKWADNTNLATVDPDVIAMNDPLQYKLAAFQTTVRFMIERGDAAYRRLTRDDLNEAKLWYAQASALLGIRPEPPLNERWSNPTLSAAAAKLPNVPAKLEKDSTSIAQFGAILEADYGDFLPPYDDELLAYWDKLQLRLYNLRHNLTLDGQALDVPLFSPPADPKEVLRQLASGDGLNSSGGSSGGPSVEYRYETVVQLARSSVSTVSQFGSSYLTALEKQDAEAMTLLVQSQQKSALQQSLGIQEQNITVLEQSLTEAQQARAGAAQRQATYADWVENWMTPEETQALETKSNASKNQTLATAFRTTAGAADSAPNIFGVAAGGTRWGAVPSALGDIKQIEADIQLNQADIQSITAQYRQRRDENLLQQRSAENEIEQLDARIAGLEEQIRMAQMQVQLATLEYENAQAVYDLQSTRFTGQALYNWLSGRLSSLYYQMYDLALSQCLLARNALSREIGADKTANLFTIPVWNDLYQGLLAGEALSIELAKMDTIWVTENKRGLEAINITSLNTQAEGKWRSMLDKVLGGSPADPVNGVTLKLDTNVFSASLDLSKLDLANSYNMKEKTRTMKSLSVTLPTLLGPYQGIEATVSFGGETITLSHGQQDSGLFVTDFNDPRFLPFENQDVTKGTITLSIHHADSNGRQRQLVENLNDVIFHIRYVIH